MNHHKGMFDNSGICVSIIVGGVCGGGGGGGGGGIKILSSVLQ